MTEAARIFRTLTQSGLKHAVQVPLCLSRWRDSATLASARSSVVIRRRSWASSSGSGSFGASRANVMSRLGGSMEASY